MIDYIDVPYQLPQYAKSRTQQGEFDRLLPDGRKLSLMPLLFGGGHIGISPMPPMQNCGVFFDSWDYLDYWHAFAQFLTWDGQGEPQDWSRHFKTGRYRIDGVAELEYVKDSDGTIEDRIRRAIYVTRGSDCINICIEETKRILPLPEEARVFIVEFEHIIREETICFHIDCVYCYRDRLVVLAMTDLMGTTRNILRRLTGENAKK
jgi:hypothetical protein